MASRSSLLVLNLRSRAPEGSRPEREGSERKCPAEGREQACWVGRAVQEPATSRTKPKGVSVELHARAGLRVSQAHSGKN